MNSLGKWITNGSERPFYTRKNIEITKEITNAVAYVCGLGQFNFYINGAKVSDHVLDPGWTNYDKLIQYVTFDVTKYLKEGVNTIGAEIGNGWFIMNNDHYTFAFPAFMPPNPNPYHAYGKSLVFAMCLEVEYKDGTKDVMTADDTFKVAEHMVTVSNVYGSEYIDGRKAQIGWNTIAFDDSKWEKAKIVAEEDEPKGELQNQTQPPIKVIHTYEGKYLHDYVDKESGEIRKIYDFSQNMSGMLEVKVKGKAGDEIHFLAAEKLSPEGDVDQMAKNWMMIDNCITYIVGKDDEWETCKLVFTYFAGRFMGVEAKSDAVEIGEMKGHAITSAYEESGTFECDDERYNQIYDMVEKAVEANMMSVHTDCPTIERFAWQEPNHLMAPAIMYMKNGKKLWEKFLLDMRVQQHTADDYFYDYEGNKFYPGDGLMPGQAPCYIPNVLPVPGMGSFYDIIPWGSTCIIGTYWHYIFYGDQKIIEDNYDAGMKYFKYLQTKVTEDGFINHGLGDWGNPRNELARENIETAFFYADAKVLARFAEMLGKDEDKGTLETYADEIKSNYNEKLLVQNEEGYWCYKNWDHPDKLVMTQASQALPLYWGLVPENKKDDIVKAFRQTLVNEQAFIAGEVGLPYVIQTARENGMNDLIAQFILREEHPSYYAFILDGETTLGEYWENNPRSHCHDMMGHIIEWYYNGIAGIIPEEPGFSKVTIKPYMPNTVNYFICTFNTPQGEIKVSARRSGKEVELDVKVPETIEYIVDRSNL